MRSSLLFILLAALPYPSFAADNPETMDIPASEYSDDAGGEAADVPSYGEMERKPFKNNREAVSVPVAPVEKQAGGVQENAPENIPESNMLVLRGLDKVTGRISTLEMPIGTLAHFENLEIIARKCWKSLPEEQPENAALMEIREVRPGEPPKQVFLGWMFSSSPALSSLEHPVYDITVLSCEYRSDLENIGTDANAEKAKKKPVKKK